MTQRPQHLLTHAARDRRVFYWEEPVWHNEEDHLAGGMGMHLEVIEETSSLWILRPHLTSGIDCDSVQQVLLAEFLKSFVVEHFIIWYYTPMAIGFTEHLEPELTIYDCMDELSAFLGAPPQLVERERQLLKLADVVFTGGLSLYEHKRSHHANVHAFPSSIDVKHFARATDYLHCTEPEDQAPIPLPRVGFYGVIDERFDINLLGEIARLRPQISFIILGPVVKIDPLSLPRAANIHYLGAKNYNQLPSYLAGWQAALLLFALNEATRYISPTKTPEYLAAGRSVVSTAIRDVVTGYGADGLVAIAETAVDFASAIDEALKPQSVEWRKSVAKKLAESSWDSTWEAMQCQIDCLQAPRSPSLIATAAVALTSSVNIPMSYSGLSIPDMSLQSLRFSTSRPRRSQTFDYLVVGAGFAGSVLAQCLTSQLGKRVLLIDKRDHIGGNAYDFYNEHGILVHKYGPHIFHTNSENVLRYLSRFTGWISYEHRVLGSVEGQLLPIPINLDTINRLYGLELDVDEMKAFLAARVIHSAVIRTSEDIVLSRVGRDLYEKFFRNYTSKQWGVDPSQLDSSVAGRIPVRFDRDDRYFSDSYQVMPVDGYTRMFERMLDQPNLTIRTGIDYKDLAPMYPDTKMIYTGPVDEYFDFQFGPLPYRSLHFRHETHDREVFQCAPVINYPNEHAYTRVTEFKYLTGQKHSKTSIVYEYPQAQGDPYYPIPCPGNAEIYARYQQLATRDSRVTFCGRLANYRYLNMDQVVGQALSTFNRIAGEVTIDSHSGNLDDKVRLSEALHEPIRSNIELRLLSPVAPL